MSIDVNLSVSLTACSLLILGHGVGLEVVRIKLFTVSAILRYLFSETNTVSVLQECLRAKKDNPKPGPKLIKLSLLVRVGSAYNGYK